MAFVEAAVMVIGSGLSSSLLSCYVAVVVAGTMAVNYL